MDSQNAFDNQDYLEIDKILQSIYNSEPKLINSVALERWKKLGPLNVESII